MTYDLKGKNVLVTGASGGIGAALAEGFAARGATVGICARRTDKLDAVLARCREHAPDSKAWTIDLADLDGLEAFAAQADKELGGIDVLVNNAGITRDRSLLKMTDDEWESVIAVHLRGMWLGCQHAIPQMRERGGGAIVNLSSEVRYGQFGQANYSSAKAGIVGLTRTVAIEHARHGIRCNAVAPGGVQSAMLAKVPEHVLERWVERIPMERFGEPREVAAVIAFLASDDASYVTGQVLGIDGGSVPS
jgi:3-oxoacyl-[acyl-carrier protein] reductase